MIYNKPIWSPNVILVDLANLSGDLYANAERLIDKLKDNEQIISVIIDHNYSSVIKSQIVLANNDYSIYKEDDKTGNSFSSKLIQFGIKHSYYVVPNEMSYRAAYVNILDILGYDYPIICFSSNLSNDIDASAIVTNSLDLKDPIKRLTLDDFISKEVFFEKKSFIIR